MGLRYRKSINLGGGFRINISKSGIGYSWGVPGMRISRGADGRTRGSVGIPGTGLYWTEVIGGSNNRRRQGRATERDPRVQENTRPQINQNRRERIPEIVNLDIDMTDDELLDEYFEETSVDEVALAIEHSIKRNGKDKVTLNYEFDDENEETYANRIAAWEILAESDKEWYVDGKECVACTITNEIPAFLETNVDTISIKYKDEQLIILPDRFFYLKHGKVTTIEYNHVEIKTDSINVPEANKVPDDANIIGTTWKYLNPNGTPNRKHTDNPQIPVCEYGVVKIKSIFGVNITLQVSNIQKCRDFEALI